MAAMGEIARMTCARCGRTFDIRAFPHFPKIRLCAHCCAMQLRDNSQGQTNIYDEGVQPYDGTDNNEKDIPKNRRYGR